MTNNTFALAIYTALPYFLQLESIQFLKADIAAFQHENFKYQSKNPPTYDFIIVGAGTAGCILANRLSRRHRVLLLDAAGPPPIPVLVPRFVIEVLDSPNLNYFYRSTPQTNVGNRTMDLTMGRMLGGSHSHNGLALNRGDSLGYDLWARLTEDPSWEYKNILEYFKKSERYTGMFPSDFHGTNGPITTETFDAKILPVWFEAGKELGYNVVDPSGPLNLGFSPLEETLKYGRRETTYTSYIKPILETRKNLKLVSYAHVVKILIQNNRARGVKYNRHGTSFRAYARNEVILSGGVFGTPMLLFKSGIGPSKMLRKAGIEPILDLPVGKYLQDHEGLVLGSFLMKKASKFHTSVLTQKKFEKYLKFEKENVLSNVGNEAQAFFASSVARSNNESNWSDIFITYSTYKKPLDTYDMVVVVMRTEFDKNVLGHIKLNHTAYKLGVEDDTQLAIIDVKFMENPSIYRILLEGIQLALNITSTKAFEAVGSELMPDVECSKKFIFKSDLYWNCLIREQSQTRYHTVGTCRMGRRRREHDMESVVDSKLRVHGLNRLRIVDASVIPVNTNANTNAAVMMIAEKTADVITKYYVRNRNKFG